MGQLSPAARSGSSDREVAQMNDQALRRTDDLLTELTEIVETARALPMSTSCVLPRERVLDLLDELREVMPPEMDDARRLISARDGVLHDAADRGEQILLEARAQAQEIVAAARMERAELVSASGVHQAASTGAAALREQAQEQVAQLRLETQRECEHLRADAEQHADALRHDAQRHAERLAVDASDYADRTLADLAATLSRAAGTAEQGRAALAARCPNVAQPDPTEALISD
jgi:cell division septum initiation protein DivIVA